MSLIVCRYSLPITVTKIAVLELCSFFEIMSAAFAYCTFSIVQVLSHMGLPAQAGIGREPHESLKWFYNATM
jgi:hypothetical protein